MNESHRSYTVARARRSEDVAMTQVIVNKMMTVNDADVAGKPELTTTPHDVDVSFGGTAYFNCRADGDPRPEIVWYRNR